ncbi:putative lipid II flippase FtsW [Paenarthrobacter sp. Z7-10]|uniref:putative lipid II flippase FtsW n=1 Tax=Paenarthrobacter sp. Z7-10 TaxID=2787635 RepID=UPI0022A992D2|nr:putative lipid II flippase FtsW [Paenarthrobacter sp. Z7-10]MCZ2402360.1 putative lipid II flippase FtsW [Paenarthrobacter sp. Z7-10]
MVTTPVRPNLRGGTPSTARAASTAASASKRSVPAALRALKPAPRPGAGRDGRSGAAGKRTGATARPGSQTAARTKGNSSLRRFFREFWPRVEGSNRPSNGSSYYLILGATLALTCVGLMMVLSSSAVEVISQGKDPYNLFLRESAFGAFGVVLMFVLSRTSIRRLKKLAWPALLLAIVLLAMVIFTPLGESVGGNRNWLRIGGFSAQPSEAAKLALALWMAAVLARKGTLILQWKHAIIPVVPAAAVVIGLVLLGHDLGTSVILMGIVAAGLYFGGARARLFIPAGVFGVLAAVVLALTSSNRTSRISGWMGNCDDGNDLCLQARNGLYALASGGWWGVGLGQSRQKWNWIPEAHNDFIFAIIGEELGLLGTLVVVLLYGILAVAIFRVIVRHRDPFIRIVCGCIMAWIIGQAFVNIAMVTGLLPVIGVPLPLISNGGSALTLVLAAVGVVLSFARSRPESEKIPS